MSRLRPITLAVACCALLWLLAACRGGGDENVPFAVEEQAKIACTETCALHGQCGTLPDEQRAVLAGSVAPVVTLHDRFFLEGNLVTVQELSQRSLIGAVNGQPLIGVATEFPHLFYRVNDQGKIGWVSEWCLERP
ncbi:exported protein of unknown function [Candidatus Promineifilum breve]|uniref:SH3b domain-containing protein n=1 Tax=Candidatus Promineifilum breve TaxID=1806508 RepID=A0A160T6Y5_9CHLR|nr:hypothetical protein [Candidatus Promineifilum breve]CUS05058.2 exported protein of unknown function [Candidatus Promineifilum breve]